ncbi:MAG: cysteine hydrolase family protein [Rubrivivax sp.]
MKTALVIVDLQNDFLAPDGAYARGGCANPAAQALPARVLPVAQAVKAAGGLVVASQFTLWPGTDGQPMVSPHLKALRPFLRAGDFAPGSHGQACVDTLLPVVDVAVQKVAYSAFFNTQLDWLLRKCGIARVAVCGIVTNGGVASTVRDAHMRDYDTWVLADGCAAFSATAHGNALADMQTVAKVVDTDAFLRDGLR